MKRSLNLYHNMSGNYITQNEYSYGIQAPKIKSDQMDMNDYEIHQYLSYHSQSPSGQRYLLFFSILQFHHIRLFNYDC